MTNAIYEKNLAALRLLNPPMAQALHSLEEKNYRREQSRAGQETLIYRSGGQDYYLHSRFNPEAEAQKIIQKSNLQADHIIIFGLGLGFHVKQVLMLKSRNARVLLIEPELEIVKHSLHSLEWYELFQRNDFHYFFGTDMNLLAASVEKFLHLVSFETLETIDFPPEVRFHGAFFSAARELIDNEIRTLLYDFKTRLAEDAMVPTNVLKNLRGILHSRPIKALKNRFIGKPGFIVSAGPSLDKNVLLLKKIRNRGVILCVDTALKPLLKRGIQPHFTITADPSYKNYLHLQGAAKDMAYFLVSETGIASQVYEDFKGNIFSVTLGRPIVKMIEQRIGEIGEIEAWGSVVSLALNVALYFGLEPVVFLGQDFAYTHTRNHCRGTSWEDTWLEYTRDLDLMQRKEKDSIAGAAKITELPDIYGNKTITSDRLILYKNYLAKIVSALPGKKLINASEGGIFKEIEQIPLHRVIRQYVYPSREIDFRVIFRIPELYYGKNKKKLLKFLRDKAKFFNSYEKKIGKLLARIEGKEGPAEGLLPGLLAEAEELKNALYADVQDGEIVEMWSQGPIYEFLKKSGKLENAGIGDIQGMRKKLLAIFVEYFTRLRPIVANISAVMGTSMDNLAGGDANVHE